MNNAKANTRGALRRTLRWCAIAIAIPAIAFGLAGVLPVLNIAPLLIRGGDLMAMLVTTHALAAAVVIHSVALMVGISCLIARRDLR